jgi:DNA polymerase I
MSNLPQQEKDKDKDKDKEFDFICQVSDADLSSIPEFVEYLPHSSFSSSIPPPNVRLKSEKSSFSLFQKSEKSFILDKDKCVLPDIKRLELLHNEFAKIPFGSMVAVDTETTGVNRFSDSLVGISLSYEDKSFYFPIGHNVDNLPLELVQSVLNPLLSRGDIVKVFHNAKFDISFLHRFGFLVDTANTFDTMVAVHSYDSSKSFVKLDVLADRVFDYSMLPITSLIGENKKSQICFNQVPPEYAYFYACEDSAVTLALGSYFSKLIRGSKVESSFNRDMALLPVVVNMEAFGSAVDVDKIRSLISVKSKEVASISENIFKEVGYRFNLNSTPALRKLLFEELKFDFVSKTDKGAFSVDKKALKSLLVDTGASVLSLLLDYRRVVKQLQFLKNLEKSQVSGRIYCNFDVIGSRTGRFSSHNPNIQNIPKVGELRSVFIPSKNNVLLRADYSQMELRFLAHFSQDINMLDCYNNNIDIHTKTAEALFNNMSVSKDSLERKVAKAVNFGIVYGISAKGLQSGLFDVDCRYSVDGAQVFIDDFYKLYPSIKPSFLESFKEAVKEGCLYTEFGSRRWFPFIGFTCGSEASAERRKASNFVIQGACADITKIAMINIFNEIEKLGLSSRMILTVHDELVFDVPKSEVEIMKALVKEYMEKAVFLSVPLIAEVSVRESWSSESEILE